MNFIAIDWGSTNLRAWRVEDNRCTDHIQIAKGVKNIAPQSFDEVLCEVLTPWRTAIEKNRIPIILAGMVGSNVGWLDSGYLTLPLTTKDIAKNCISLETSLNTHVWLHPGIAVKTLEGANVMRGEEVQFLGAITAVSADIYVFPGTHSKWVKPIPQANDYLIDQFETVITGELYQLLMTHSLMGQDTLTAPFCPQAFIRGVESGHQHPTDIIRHIFLARSRRVLGLTPPEQTGSWLSGLLIGHELTDLLMAHHDIKHIALIGDEPLVNYYQNAAEHLGITTTIINADKAVINGFRGLYESL